MFPQNLCNGTRHPEIRLRCRSKGPYGTVVDIQILLFLLVFAKCIIPYSEVGVKVFYINTVSCLLCTIQRELETLSFLPDSLI